MVSLGRRDPYLSVLILLGWTNNVSKGTVKVHIPGKTGVREFGALVAKEGGVNEVRTS